ncbi:SDR family NAD(P)-dependent oxidoreductase [Promicromonospora sp. MS192]|uniref:SDR family NAD(P)-dependent oxidoreductase n=1 Tax=Promicromonospora sp. MS192 TaxID=3412684 RepID=UPI003C2B86E3
MPWDPNALPNQRGRVVAVTGATAGIGYFAAEQLATAGAHVVLLGRSPAKLAAAERAIRAHAPGASTGSIVLDLAELESVDAAARRLSELPALHGAFLNGGPDPTVHGLSPDGLPIQLATHAVGNVALAHRVLPILSHHARDESTRARLVYASTGFTQQISMSLEDLLAVPRLPFGAYIKARAALEVHAYALDRTLRSEGVPVDALVAIPGVASDAKTPERAGVRDASTPFVRHPLAPWTRGKDVGAWAAVRALTDPSARGGECYGPTGPFHGEPVRISRPAWTAQPPEATVSKVTTLLERLAGLSRPGFSGGSELTLRR